MNVNIWFPPLQRLETGFKVAEVMNFYIYRLNILRSNCKSRIFGIKNELIWDYLYQDLLKI